MPEGDAVWRTARRLAGALVGSQLVSTDFRVPLLATVDLTGATVVDVGTHGKHLLIRLDTDTTIHSHLRMDGRWWTGVVSARLPGPAHDIRVILATDRAVAVGLRIHDVAVVPTPDEGQLVGHLGPDILSDDWDVDEAVRRLRAQPDRTVGEALLDQRVVAGLGTIYRAEALFLSGVSPWAKVTAVADLAGVVSLARRLMLANRERAGRTGIVTTGDTRRGHRLHVYDRAGRPCLRCGSHIRAAMIGPPPYDRVVYWCATCQPGEPADVTDAGVVSRGRESPRPT